MIVYEATKEIFISDVLRDFIVDKIYSEYIKKIGHTTKNEIRSWANSMLFMDKVLNTQEIPDDSGIAVEFKVPYTSKRVDFIISGKNQENKNSVVIIELKQWESAEAVKNKDGIVKTFLGGGIKETTHPSYQAWSYATCIEDYNQTVQDKKILIIPCAYLHNYIKINPDTITDKMYSCYLNQAPVFVKGDAEKLREFIKKHVKYGDNKETLYMIENGKLRPSKSLQDSLSKMLNGNPEFIMIDEQKLVYENAFEKATQSYKDSKKRVLIVKGGPGTGKSVLAINLLVNLTKENLVCQYASKNAAPRNVYISKLAGQMQKVRIYNLFKGSGNFVDSERNEFDALIVDEAHRLNKNSGLFRNKGENQIKEIINASKFSAFFIDESQKIDIYDIGSVEEIVKHCKELKADYEIVELTSQFRCNGSDGYIAWLDDVLQIRETANSDGFDLDYDIQIYDNPNEMKEKIEELNSINNKSRIVAGYCWNWLKENKDKKEIFDIQIPEYDFKMSWNLNNTQTWAIDDNSVKEAGCIHTCQGLEFDYVGVIIGKDLRYENGKIITDFKERADTDNSLKGIKKMYQDNPDKAIQLAGEIIKNTYRTLMTRGQKGCFIYCEDKALARYLKMRIFDVNKNIVYYGYKKNSENMKVAEDMEIYK